MDFPSLLSKRIQEVKAYVDSVAWRQNFWTRVSATSADGSADGVEGWPRTEGDPATPQPTVRKLEPWGVHGRPTTGVYSLVSRVMAGAASGLQVGLWVGGYGRQNLAAGETQIYCSANGCEIWLDKDGKIRINSASGQDVIFNGGSLQVARKTDPTVDGTISMTVVNSTPGGVPTAVVTFLYTPPSGSPSTIGTLTFAAGLFVAPGVNGSASIVGKINDGAANVKG